MADYGKIDVNAETKALDRVARSAELRFPDIAPEAIAERLQVARLLFAGAPIRDFVPLLVERMLTAELRSGAVADR